MTRTLIVLMLCMHLLLPAAAWAQSTLKNPLSYSLREYGVILGIALLGGVVSWYSKVRKGELLMWNISALIGELAVSAFAGLLAFWLCEWMNFHPLLTPAVVGMSGHAGAKGLSWVESVGQRVVEKRLGIDTSIPNKEPPA